MSSQNQIIKNISVFATITIIAVACGPAKETMMSQRSDAPEWVNKGSGAFDEKNVLYGVGTSSMKDVTVSRKQAADRAREEIATQIGVKIKSLSKNYTTAKAGSSNAVSADVYTSVSENIVNKTIAGVTIIDYYKDPDANVTYALASLDFKKVKEAINAQMEFDESVRQALISDMEKMFSELDEKTK